MKVWGIPTLLVISVLEGIKVMYGIEVLKSGESSILNVWKKREMSVLAGMWLIFYGFTWFLSGKSILIVRIANLLCTYGILAIVDGKCRIVPDEILGCYFVGQMLLGALCIIPADLLMVCLSGFIFSIFLFAIVWFSKDKVGIGDVKLLCITAMTAGWKYTLYLLVLALFLSFLYSIYLIAFQKMSIKTELPFVPFLALGAIIQLIIW